MSPKKLDSILKSRARKIMAEVALKDFLRPQNTISDWFSGINRGRVDFNSEYIISTYQHCFLHDISNHSKYDFTDCIRYSNLVEEISFSNSDLKNSFPSSTIDKNIIYRFLYKSGTTLTKSIMDLRKRRRERKERFEFTSSLSFLDKIRSRSLTPDVFHYERAVGIEIECYGEFLKEKLPYWSRESYDGSLNSGGVEFKLLIKRSELETRLNRFANLIKGTHKVNRTCGLHVHLDQRGKSREEVLKLAKKLDKWLYALREFVPESRRSSSEGRKNYCKFGVSASGNDRYRAVNMDAFFKYKTLEVRLHSGTTDYTKIISWIRLIEILSVIKAPAKGLEGISALALIPLCEYEKSYWLKRHQELNPRLYTSTTPSTETE
jgi:hypothetical protein